MNNSTSTLVPPSCDLAAPEQNWVDVVIRPNHHPNKRISFLWKRGALMVELLYVPGDGLSFAIKEGNDYRTEKSVNGFSPLPWIEGYARSKALRLPSCLEAHISLDNLVEEIRSFIHRYFDCDPVFESVAVLYVLHTWVYERFQAVPYLRFLGINGSGKSRGTQTIGAVCYRPLVIAGSATPAAMFRQIEATGGTVLIDEADYRNSQIGSDIIKVLNCGYQQGLPVTRMEKTGDTEFVPRLYEVFGPKIINSRKPFQDDATESRCLLYVANMTERTDLPTHLPEKFEHKARHIRNMCLAWRMETLDSFEVVEQNIPNVRRRTNQLILPLISIAQRMNAGNENRYRADLLEYCKIAEEQTQQEQRESIEAKLLSAYVSIGHARPTCKELVDHVLSSDGGDGSDDVDGYRLTPQRGAQILRVMGFATRRTNRGAEVTIKESTLVSLCGRYGIEVPKEGPGFRAA